MGTSDLKQQLHVSYLSLGSNIGNKAKNLSDAIALLSNEKNIRIIASSSVYDTAPQNFQYQPNFFNCVVQVSTILSPHELLETCQKIERTLGRTKNFRYGPRVIDIDILLYDTQIIQEEELMIPHPELINRNFVLSPLNELAPHLIINKKPIDFWLKRCQNQFVKKLTKI